MDWLKTILKNAGIEVPDEVFSNIQKELPKHLIPKGEYNAKLEEIKGLNTQISERDGQLEKLKDSAGENESLKQQITTLQTENKTAADNFKKQINDIHFNYGIEKALTGAKAKNAKAVQALLNMDELKYEDGKISGLDKQLEAIKKDNGYLFEAEEEKLPPQFTQQHTFSGGASGIDARAVMGLPTK